ncbi:Predicted DNA-binding protein, MmcQ/YjbR family [Microbacterium sp. cf046]|uniref:MmcQ/YjbR family DNA-binding protein n=1 Tax=Microbacterium sp. cf046 TaxID=1761803 RepID=UPI0008F14488|nr:MmcQ/YjbR family DNA-binding protein [Microbacterium sp. cf046]SFR93431.1 Predicted DNA-binding protein, MmcQ/YjbR family [Microbacterium sp. cf046]
MIPEDVRAYCAAKWGAWEDQPWEGDVVFKVGPDARGKIFVFFGDGTSIGVKAATTREEADDWLVRYPQDARVSPYIGRSGWNVLATGGGIPDDELREAIDHSYELVLAGLPKKLRGPGAD